MPVIPCNYQTDCTPCDPVLDTQEAPDTPRFLSVCYPVYTPRLSIPVDPIFGVRWCFSVVSLAAAVSCCNETPPPPEPVPMTFVNEARSASCPEGNNLLVHTPLPANLSVFMATLTVAAGSFSAPTQAAANTLAQDYVDDFLAAALASGDCECEFVDMEWVAETVYLGMTGGNPAQGNNCSGTTTFQSIDGTFGPWPTDPATYTQINQGLHFEMSVDTHTNSHYYTGVGCAGMLPCELSFVTRFFSTSEIGPFLEDRNISVLFTGYLQRSASQISEAASGCIATDDPNPFGSGISGSIVVTGIGTVAQTTVSCTAAESTKAYSFTLNYVLPAGSTFYVNGNLLAMGSGSISYTNITISITPV